jgi:hypothetical protein
MYVYEYQTGLDQQAVLGGTGSCCCWNWSDAVMLQLQLLVMHDALQQQWSLAFHGGVDG